TRAVSATGEGVHTTARRQLLILENGTLLIDTPGMRELGLLGTGDEVNDTFAEIREYSGNCRFTNCTHTGEPGCAVLLAVANGTLGEDRYQSYLKLKKESEFHDLSRVGKRRKDRSFGRFLKSAKKSLKE
ncbi:MAG: GTPase RsgA, partial [Verrucomicrobia bacterium]|nr:GTPase RsgA [Verrucomicrobiota bacterium]